MIQFNVATYNCRGLNKVKNLEVKQLIEKYNIDILFIQESHFNKISEGNELDILISEVNELDK